MVVIATGGKAHRLGSFADEDAAAAAYAAASHEIGRDPTPTSQYRGVKMLKVSGRWKAAIALARTRQYLGAFATELEAARVGLRRHLRRPT